MDMEDALWAGGALLLGAIGISIYKLKGTLPFNL